MQSNFRKIKFSTNIRIEKFFENIRVKSAHVYQNVHVISIVDNFDCHNCNHPPPDTFEDNRLKQGSPTDLSAKLNQKYLIFPVSLTEHLLFLCDRKIIN